MKYKDICPGIFMERLNRFAARVLVDGKEAIVHVKNTGRCRELFLPGAQVFLEDHEGRMGTRKLRYSLIGVVKQVSCGTLLVNTDSQAPNVVVGEALRKGRLILPGMTLPYTVRAEQTRGDSRLDFFLRDSCGKEGFVEVKGVTLESGGHARFPDAPTSRGRKHVEELERAAVEGQDAYVVFVIQMEGMKDFTPNDDTDPDFGRALRKAAESGVMILAYGCLVTKDSLTLGEKVPVLL